MLGPFLNSLWFSFDEAKKRSKEISNEEHHEQGDNYNWTIVAGTTKGSDLVAKED